MSCVCEISNIFRGGIHSWVGINKCVKLAVPLPGKLQRPSDFLHSSHMLSSELLLLLLCSTHRAHSHRQSCCPACHTFFHSVHRSILLSQVRVNLEMKTSSTRAVPYEAPSKYLQRLCFCLEVLLVWEEKSFHSSED